MCGGDGGRTRSRRHPTRCRQAGCPPFRANGRRILCRRAPETQSGRAAWQRHRGRSPASQLLPLVLPGIVVGVASALILIVVSELAKAIQDVIWDTLPANLGIASDSPGWILGVLTLTGLVVGLVVTFVPGHAGPDPATTELAAPPLPLAVLPGLAVALVITLASGVSLGPENPILAVNIGLAAAIGLRVVPRIPVPAWAGLALSGTLGAMFGTPLGAALLLTESPDTSGRPLWDRLFGPLIAASAGALTMLLLGGESFALSIAPYGSPQLIDLLTGSLIAWRRRCWDLPRSTPSPSFTRPSTASVRRSSS